MEVRGAGMATRARVKSPEGRFEAIQQELDEHKRELAALEASLEGDSTNPFLLKKYERLAKREALLLEERRLWAGAVLDGYNWQVGLLAAPGVNAMLERLVAAADAGAASGLAQPSDSQPAGGDAGAAGRGRKRGRHGGVLQSPDKAQLMLLANAADATEEPAGGRARGRTPGRSVKRQAGGRVRPFHVARTGGRSAHCSEESDEGPPVEIPVALSSEERLADYTRDRLAGEPRAPEGAGTDPPSEAAASGASTEGSALPGSLEARAGSPVPAQAAELAATASTQGAGLAAASAAELTTATARLLGEGRTPVGSTTALSALPQAAAEAAGEAAAAAPQAAAAAGARTPMKQEQAAMEVDGKAAEAPLAEQPPPKPPA